MSDLKLQAILALTQTVENLSEVLLNLPDEDQEGMFETEPCPYPGEYDSNLSQIEPEECARIDQIFQSLRDDSEREQDQEERLRNLESRLGLGDIGVPAHIKGESSEDAEIQGIVAGVEAALQKIFGSGTTIRRIYP